MVITVSNITKAFGTDTVLDNVSLQINDKEKYAICGSNGTGKSTLLKIIVGEMSADAGEVHLAKELRIGYLAQYSEEAGGETIIDSVINARADLIKMEKRLHELEQDMSEESDILEHDELMRRFEQAGGLIYKSLAKSILNGLGFTDTELNKTLDMLSGGEMTRVGLAKLLISDNDLLILDEPTAGLDPTAHREILEIGRSLVQLRDILRQLLSVALPERCCHLTHLARGLLPYIALPVHQLIVQEPECQRLLLLSHVCRILT